MLHLYDRAEGGIIARVAHLPAFMHDAERRRCVPPLNKRQDNRGG